MIKEINTGKARLLFVKAPDGEIPCHTYENTLSLRDGKSGTLCNAIELPPGNWSDPVRVEEVTEEIAKGIISDKGGKIFDYDPKHYHSYEDYTLVDHPFDSRFFDNAIESFQSLLKANDIYTVNPYPCPYTFGTMSEEMFTEKQRQHNSGKENTGNWVMLIDTP